MMKLLPTTGPRMGAYLRMTACVSMSIFTVSIHANKPLLGAASSALHMHATHHTQEQQLAAALTAAHLTPQA